MKTLTNDQVMSARQIAMWLWQLKIISGREFGKICARVERPRRNTK